MSGSIHSMQAMRGRVPEAWAVVDMVLAAPLDIQRLRDTANILPDVRERTGLQ
jgi:hypothetical protein